MRAVGISISYSTTVDEACYFPCVRRLDVPLPPLTPRCMYTATYTRLRTRAIFVDLSDVATLTSDVARVCLWSHGIPGQSVKCHFRLVGQWSPGQRESSGQTRIETDEMAPPGHSGIVIVTKCGLFKSAET